MPSRISYASMAMNPPFLYALRPLYNLLRPGGQRSWIRGFAPPCSCCRIARGLRQDRAGEVRHESEFETVAWYGTRWTTNQSFRTVPQRNRRYRNVEFPGFLLCTTVCGYGTESLLRPLMTSVPRLRGTETSAAGVSLFRTTPMGVYPVPQRARPHQPVRPAHPRPCHPRPVRSPDCSIPSIVRPCLRYGMNLLSTVLFPRERT